VVKNTLARSRIQGITVEIGGDTIGLQKSMQDVNTKTRDLQKELNDVNRLLKFDPKNPELLAQKTELLNEQIEATNEKLGRLKEAQIQVEEQFKKGEIGETEYRNFQRELIATEGYLNHLKSQLAESSNKMKDFGEAMQRAGGKMKDIGGKMSDAGKSITKNFTAPLLGAIASIGLLTKSAGEFADQLLDTEAMTGITTDTLQAFERIEARAGMSTGTLSNTVSGLNKRFADTEMVGKRAKTAIENMGHSVEDFVNLPAEEKMDAVMESMQGLGQQERIDLANLLGITDMLPALEVADSDWSDFRKTMSEGAIPKENLETMANFTNGINEMKQQMKLHCSKH
jgi:phage-related minor tail protein